MREINEIVVHHSLTPKYLSLEASMSSFNRTHKDRLTPLGQPVSEEPYPHIAYHYCISDKGAYAVGRAAKDMGFHASNYEVNKHSLGICMVGNFDKENPSVEQISALKSLVQNLKIDFPAIEKVSFHRDYAQKSCPGKNISDDLKTELNDLISQQWYTKAQEWAINEGLTEKGSRPLDYMTRAEYWQSEYNKAN